MSHKETEIIQWGLDRNIIGPEGRATTASQCIKTLEEVEELAGAIISNDKPEVIDAIGDIYVTLVLQANLWGVDMDHCIDAAYKEIQHRTGKMVDGAFVKDSAPPP